MQNEDFQLLQLKILSLITNLTKDERLQIKRIYKFVVPRRTKTTISETKSNASIQTETKEEFSFNFGRSKQEIFEAVEAEDQYIKEYNWN